MFHSPGLSDDYWISLASNFIHAHDPSDIVQFAFAKYFEKDPSGEVTKIYVILGLFGRDYSFLSFIRHTYIPLTWLEFTKAVVMMTCL